MAYLIMKCDELGDQWECDADRTPICIVEDYKTFTDNITMVDGIEVSYRWEAYLVNSDNTIGKCVKHYDEFLDEGMAFTCWTYDENYNLIGMDVIKKWKNRTLKDEIPNEVKEQFKKVEFFNDYLKLQGYISWNIDNNRYVYGEYYDDSYEIGY